MADTPAPLAEVQFALSRHLRAPDAAPAPDDIEPRRLAVYRELLYNNVEGFLAGYYPVLRRITPDARWHALVRDWYASHRARTPLFPRLPREFLDWLEQRPLAPDDPPFLRELARYEWAEAALAIDPREIDPAGVDPAGDLLDGIPVASPLLWPLAFAWPVHRVGPDYQPDAPPPEPTYLVVFRDRADDVRFLELNAVSARLLELVLAGGDATGRALLLTIAAELRHPDPATVVAAGAAVLADLRARDILLGTRA